MPRQRPNVQSQPVHEPRQRLYVTATLAAEAKISLTGNQEQYLRKVLRCQTGDAVLVFNGADGEWQAQIEALGKKQAELVIGTQHRPQSAAAIYGCWSRRSSATGWIIWRKRQRKWVCRGWCR